MAKQILSEEFKRIQKLAGLINESHLNENSKKKLNISDVISRFIDTLSKKHNIVSNNLLIGKTGTKLNIYTQDEYGYLKLLETININDL